VPKALLLAKTRFAGYQQKQTAGNDSESGYQLRCQLGLIFPAFLAETMAVIGPLLPEL
jgi:hypothetical protein